MEAFDLDSGVADQDDGTTDRYFDCFFDDKPDAATDWCSPGTSEANVACPWPEAEREQRLREIQAMIAKLPPNEIGVDEDESHIHLNPKIGQD